MAPAQVIEPKDLPPELEAGAAPMPLAGLAAQATPVSPGPPPLAAAADDTAPAVLATPAVRSESSPALPMAAAASDAWLPDLQRQARRMLEAGEPEVWKALSSQFEAGLIRVALAVTRGRRIEAANKLGIGRNTITRKIQELGLDD